MEKALDQRMAAVKEDFVWPSKMLMTKPLKAGSLKK